MGRPPTEPAAACRPDRQPRLHRAGEPVAALGYGREELRAIKPVHHLAIGAAKDSGTGAPVDRTLSDAEWADIAREFIHRIGMARRDDDLGGRGVAVRHTLLRRLRRWDGPAASAGAQVGPVASAARRGGLDRRLGAWRTAGPDGQVRADRDGELRIWKQSTLAAGRDSEHIAASLASDPAGAADAAWAASDFLAAAGRVVEGRKGGPLTEAAHSYDQAARELHGRVPAPTAAGTGLRAAGRLLLSA